MVTISQGAHVVQMYISKKDRTAEMPIKELKGFEKIFLSPGESTIVTFEIQPKHLRRYIEKDEEYQVLPGAYQVMIGDLIDEFYVL